MYIRAKVNRIDQTESVASRDISGLDPDQTIGNIVPQLLKTVSSILLPFGESRQHVYTAERCWIWKRLWVNARLIPSRSYNFSSSPKPAFLRLKVIPVPLYESLTYSIAPRHRLTDVSQTMANLYWLIRSDQATISHPEIGRDTTAYSVQDLEFPGVVLRDQAILDKLIVHPCVLSALRLVTQSLSSLNENFQAKPVSHRNVMTKSTTSPGSQGYTVDQTMLTMTLIPTPPDNHRDPSQSCSLPMEDRVGWTQIPLGEQHSSLVRTPGSANLYASVDINCRLQSLRLKVSSAVVAYTYHHSLLRRWRPVSGSSTSPTTNSVTPRITSSALSQALASVPSLTARQNKPTTSSSSTAASHTAEFISGHTENRWVTQLAQLAEMVVTDELAARQALETTNRDIAMTVQLLFG
ncbi:hypothetical protein X801_08975 [Opisthorchis viverrini]|uniref:UBA domain-containing protein n=1 Tax=Opisthorchis viverrini TaxID=6198 RepID=A0A1S8WLB8_OPIVI|nr:hypothetical protein X801_08975 [Opisthorchis viverrini]